MNKKIAIAFLLILAISGLLANFTFAAYSVSDGDTITFTAKNNPESAGDMTGVNAVAGIIPLIGQIFIEKVEDRLISSSTIPKGEPRQLIYRVVDNRPEDEDGNKPKWQLQINLSMTGGSNASGLPWTPDSWTKSIILELPEDTDNPDPTYIQLPRGGTYDGPVDIEYQISPGSSPGNGDTVSINYDIAYDSYVTIQIYDLDGNLVRTLISNELKSFGNASDIWNGRNDADALVPEGIYTMTINGVNSINANETWMLSEEIVVDNSLPDAAIDFIKADTPKYNQYTIIGTAIDAHLDQYTLTCTDCIPQVEIVTSQNNVGNGVLGVLNAGTITDGQYTIELVATDLSGNSSTSTFPIVLNRATNSVRIHVDSVAQNVYAGSEGYLHSSDDPDVWIDDTLPAGSTPMETWEWNTAIKYSGRQSHTDAGSEGIQGHYFIHSDDTLSLTSNDNIIQYVYLDPSDPPGQILLQFYTDAGNGEHRAYWGNNNVPTGGSLGTASLYRMGKLPEVGKWIRLKIPASTVGLSGKEVKGVAFATYNGKAYWDKTTTSSNYNETQEASWVLASQDFSEPGTDTIFSYSTSRDANITLSIYDAENNIVRALIDEFKVAGFHQIVWDRKDNTGNQAPDAKYYFQFGSPDGPISSNAYALLPGDWSSEAVDVNTSVTDSSGNRYEIDFVNHVVNKYDSVNALLFSITADDLGVDAFTPAALDLDINDNLFIVDNGQSKIFKLNSEGYYLNKLPYPPDVPWADSSFVLNGPTAVSLDSNGDLLIANQNGSENLKLPAGRGVINVENITAEIRVPYEESLVYAYIPIVGTAAAMNFQKYKVEYGYGENPTEWTTLITSYNEVFDDYQPLPGHRTLRGNLATWHITVNPYDRTGGLPMGKYTIRLRVYDQANNYKDDMVRVQVARVVGRSKDIVTSDDGLVTFAPGGIPDDNDLFSIVPVDLTEVPPIDNPDLTLVGQIYEVKPAGYRFTSESTLSMYYTNEQLGSIDENTLKIYRWNPNIQRWIFVDSDLDIENNVLSFTLSEFNDYEVYYAIMSGLPSTPIIYQPPSPTIFKNITVYGKAIPNFQVEIFVGGVSHGTALSDEHTGDFIKTGVQLSQGDNYLTARTLDLMGNASPLSDPVLVQMAITEPTDITSVTFKTSDFSSNFNEDVTIGDFLYIELVGADVDAASIDSTIVTLTSSITDLSGVSLQLLETAVDSGIYRVVAKVGETSNASTGTIGALTPGETITVTSNVDPGKQDTLNTVDTIPPPAPNISSSTHPSLCQDTFEANLDEWTNMSKSYGATVTRSMGPASSGFYSVKLYNTENGGDFANYIRTSSFDARQYPVVSFDYKIPNDIKINLIAYVNGMWKEIVFTDDPKTVETFDEDLYRTIGSIENVVADNFWHHAEFNLYNMLKNDDPGQAEYIVEELFFADYNLPGWMELIMGDENQQGATYYIDNFIITEGGKSNNDPIFTWSPNDLSVVEYSHLLDQNPGTLPDAISEGGANSVSYNDVADGTWYFHVRSLDGGGNWGPANHYQIMIDANGPTADSPDPVYGSSSGSLEVKLHITDGSGSGVDPDTIQLKLNDTTYDMSSGGLKYDADSGTLTFSLWKVFPVQDPWLDGETVQASLIAANDFAGNPLQNIFSWSWTVDYSELAGGYLSLLTTQGGYTPTWSSDGTMIAFMSERSGNEDIWVMESDDYAELRGTALQVTVSETNDHHPAWSPIDDRIAFVSDRDGIEHIYLINADATGLTQLTSGDEDDSHPTWSPDGLKIAFSRNGEIWTINADGTNETQVTIDSVEWNLDPVWSPGGEKIAFTQSLYMDQVAVMNADGSSLKTLTASGADFLPTWSRETDQIIFVTQRDEKTRAVWVVNSNGSNERAYLSNENMWWDSEPEQSPVDDKIAFQSTRNGTWNIWVKTQLQAPDITASPDPFSPNDDETKDTTNITFNLVGGTAQVDLKVYDSGDSLVATLLEHQLAEIGENIVIWDGRNDSGIIVPDGTYTCKISIEGSAGADSIESSCTVIVDNTPPVFAGWVVPEFNSSTQGPQNILVNVTDGTSVNTAATRLQYSIASYDMLPSPDVIGWTDFGNGSSGTLELNWSNFNGKYLFIRCYAEDEHGNAAYSNVYKTFIGDVEPTDVDGDGMLDDWEQLIVDANPNDNKVNIYDVLPRDDFDGDGFSNLREFMSDSEGANILDIPNCWADIYDDGDVDGEDLALFIVDFGRSDCSVENPCVSDLDYDNDADSLDLMFFGEDYGRTDCQ